MKSLGAMVQQLCAMVGTNDLTKWETDFMCSIGRTTGDGEHTQGLTERQVNRVEELYRKHFGDAETA